MHQSFPPFQSLVIVQEGRGGTFYLFYCDRDWRVLTDTWHKTLEDAKAQAEFEYEGIAQAWETFPMDA